MAKETHYKPFHKGEKVWLEGTHLRLPYKTMKLAPRQYRPFKVTTKISDVACRLDVTNKGFSFLTLPIYTSDDLLVITHSYTITNYAY
jgi:hypothetical protein